MTPHDPNDHGPGHGGQSLPLTHPLSGAKVPGIVNLIFRGMFLFFQRKQMIEILIPNMGSEHVYRAGLFLGETGLPPLPMEEPYVLRGVKLEGAGFATIPFSGFPYRGNITQADVWARVVVPRPFAVHSLRPTAFGVSAEDPWGLVDKKNFDIMHVLRYHADDLRAVHLARHSLPNVDDPGIQVIDGKSYKNIHIVSEPEMQDAGMHHPIRGFEKLMNLFEGLQGTIALTDIQPTTIEDLESTAMPDGSLGFSRVELITYTEQRNLMIRAGRAWRLDATAGVSADALLVDSPPNQCLPGVGGD
jgi:hypothetical protein